MEKTGIIYKLVSRDINIKELYIGSTCSFRARKCQHKKVCSDEHNPRYKCNVYQFIRANGGWDSFDMIQVEEFKHDTKQELHARERYWIEELKATLNVQIPTRTIQEYRQDNKEYIFDRNKQYRKDNKDVIIERTKQYYENNKERIVEKAKHRYQDNKEYIANQRKQKYTCECGSTIRSSDKAIHNKSAKHMAWAAAEIVEA